MRYRTLFVALLAVIGVVPLLKEGTFGALVLQIGFSLMVLSAFYAASKGKYAKVVGVAVAVPALLLSWAGAGGLSPAAHAIGVVLMSALLLFTMKEILVQVLQAQRATAEIVAGAVCVYLMMGIVGAMLFGLLDVWQPGALRLPEIAGTAFNDAERFGNVLYFSFVTLTTLGYGDITPVSNLARSLAMVEAIMGQLYLVVLVAGIVGLHIAHSTSPPD